LNIRLAIKPFATRQRLSRSNGNCKCFPWTGPVPPRIFDTNRQAIKKLAALDTFLRILHGNIDGE
jgi:hypothetical protein